MKIGLAKLSKLLREARTESHWKWAHRSWEEAQAERSRPAHTWCPGHGGCKLCPQSWLLLRDQCYQVSKSTGTWMEGKKDCESRGSHLAVLQNTTDMEHLNEGIRQDSKPKQPMWIGLKVSKYTWKWVDNSSFNAARFSSLQSAENGCATLKDKKLEVDGCGTNQKWVCQTEPFHLLSKTAGDRELYGAHPEKTSLQDACCKYLGEANPPCCGSARNFRV